MKILINGGWLNDEPAAEGESILVTDGRKAKGGGYAGHMEVYKTTLVPVMVNAKDLVLLFPDEALAELDDLADDKSNNKGDRGKARKILTLLSSGEPLEASSDTFLELLTWATILESFTQDTATDILTSLGIATK